MTRRERPPIQRLRGGGDPDETYMLDDPRVLADLIASPKVRAPEGEVVEHDRDYWRNIYGQ